MKESEYRKYKRQFEKEFDQKMQALNALWFKLGNTKIPDEKEQKSAIATPSTIALKLPNKQDKKPKTQIIREALEAVPVKFKTRDISSYIQQNYPDIPIKGSYIATQLSILSKKIPPTVVTTKNGNRKKGYIYEKKDQQENISTGL